MHGGGQKKSLFSLVEVSFSLVGAGRVSVGSVTSCGQFESVDRVSVGGVASCGRFELVDRVCRVDRVY